MNNYDIKEVKRSVLCKNCLNCKIKKGVIYCKKGFFNKISPNKPLLLSPLDFECYDFDEI